MARPPLPLGTWGTVTTRKVRGGWEARARFRDMDGVTRLYSRRGKTAGGARDALTEYLRDKAAVDREGLVQDTSTVSDLLRAWWEIKEPDLATNSRDRYQATMRLHLRPRLGHVRLHEATTGRLDRTIRAIATEVGAETARQARNILVQAFGLALRQGAVTTNAAAGIETVKVEHETARALTDDEVRRLIQAAREWEAAGHNSSRPYQREILVSILVMLGTGLRIGELLALRWSDLNLAGDAATITVTGTIVKGRRQPLPKTRASERTVYLPRFVVAALTAWRDSRRIATEQVFPSINGRWRDPSSYRVHFREVRALAKLPDVTPHDLRATVATALDRAAGVDAAAGQLGHSSPAVTTRHYIEKLNMGPREAIDVMDSYHDNLGLAA
ncbi:tyrosine-type recombinase/integrase [Sediminivirga luteola]|uniref:Phage integrase n=1 Tax=Sediminivirga luteola TaxID=1774748 RepID=A0A8J2TXA0_9MICO|nr:site-specific integrase [Sediminivirga luteola]GGA11132.1 phage integrase [Sediminivirga luteola]